jgi:CHAT domain-containing protein
VALIESAFAELKTHPEIGRAEAMRRSMLALIDEGLPPSSWAPFVVVGEGAGAQ